MAIRVGIFGYGNLGRGVEQAIRHNPDMELVGVFTRRDPAGLTIKTPGVKVYSEDALVKQEVPMDVLILCGGSATDLPVQGPKYAALYNIIDSFDTHAHIPEHFADVDAASKAAGKIGTFWGKGVSQGHSDAVRRIDGGVDARQYTIPVPAALEAVRAGKAPELTTREKHTRECFVVAEEGADLARIENEIKTMPNYFDEYDTTVHFITAEEMARDHAGLPHGGSVLYSGVTGANDEHTHVIEYSLKLDSNPEFTGSVLVAFARAAYRLNQEGQCGCKTVLDIAPAYLSPMSGEDLRAHML